MERLQIFCILPSQIREIERFGTELICCELLFNLLNSANNRKNVEICGFDSRKPVCKCSKNVYRASCVGVKYG